MIIRFLESTPNVLLTIVATRLGFNGNTLRTSAILGSAAKSRHPAQLVTVTGVSGIKLPPANTGPYTLMAVQLFKCLLRGPLTRRKRS